ncbi:hypothetical protein JTE90_002051 [Oedothorax gibbosus]|uniref:Uncharacterized protein n=1 Tax=Oedothorax gibbosus TaxID=931172 RepID=A0AAV6TFA3_9ARAC|nr:hypothetical protein JTE90_002051 [Oedothorax gibbosus]
MPGGRIPRSQGRGEMWRLGVSVPETGLAASPDRGCCKYRRGGRPHSGSPFPRGRGAPETRRVHLWKWRSLKRTRWDPKDGELFPGQDEARGNSVEVRSGSDVQIDVRSGSSGVRTNRTNLVVGSLRSFPQDSWRSLNSVSLVKRMIRGLGAEKDLNLFSNFKWVRSPPCMTEGRTRTG